MKILAIDTAFQDGRIGLVDDGKTVAEETLDAGHLESHTFTAIVKLGIQPNLDGIDLIALAAGPGSFTGLKIGTVVAKSLSFLQGKPFRGVGTLPWLAASFGEGIVLPFIKSHGDKFYWGLYKVTGTSGNNIIPEELIAPVAANANQILESIKSAGFSGKLTSVGIKGDDVEPDLPWPIKQVDLPLSLLATLAEIEFKGKGSHDPVTYTPTYIGRSQAEEKLNING
jgi:tRNA threonylcarbamoyladenosine biosynthesis protein TsaB